MPNLKNKICLVTGSTSGIGRGIAEHFAELGGMVVLSGRDAARGEAAAKKIRDCGGDAIFELADLTDEAACRALVDFAVAHFGGLDVLVNNAADMTRGNVEQIPLADWDRILSINLRAPFILIQRAIPAMKARGGGSIINIGSVNAYIGEPKLCAYSASKGGLMTLTKNAASYLGRYCIRVNQINVGWTHTEGEEKIKKLGGKGPEWLDEAIASRPFGRMLLPRDIALAAAYFASSDGEAVSGTVMDLEQHPVGAPPNF